MTDELKQEMTEIFNANYGEEVTEGLREALLKIYLKGGEYSYEHAVDKACEWIEKNMFEKCEFDEYGNITQTYACSNDCDFVSQFVEQMRKAMEE